MKNHFPSLLLLLATGLIVFGYGAGKRDLWAPDEPRFGQVAREMLQRLHSPDPAVREAAPFVLYVNQRLYSDKPPLYIWLVAAINGGDGSSMSNRAARAPSVMAGILGLWVTYFFGLALFGSRRAGLLSAIVLATSQSYAWQANHAQLDMLLSGWSYLCMLGFWLGYRSTNRGRRLAWFALFWIAGALATLSKGPPGLIVALGGAAFFLMWQSDGVRTFRTAVLWTVGVLAATLLGKVPSARGTLLFTVTGAIVAVLVVWSLAIWFASLRAKSPRRVMSQVLLFLAGLALCLAVIGIWFIPYPVHAPKKALEDTLVSQNLTRYLAAEHHAAWIGYYVENFPVNVLPWTLFMVAAFLFAWKSAEAMAPEARRFLASWFLFALIFFSLTPGKRDQYMLPAYPALALACGWFFDQALRRGAGAFGKWLTVPAYLLAIVCGLAAPVAFALQFVFNAPGPALTNWRARFSQWILADTLDLSRIGLWAMGLFLAAMCVALVVSARRRKVWGIFAGSAIAMAGICFYLNGFLFPATNPIKSGRAISDAVRKTRTAPDAPVGIYDFFRAEYILYGDFFLHDIDKEDQTGDHQVRAFLGQPRQAFLIFRDTQYDKLKSRLPDLAMRVVLSQRVGHRGLVLVDNQTSATRTRAR
jgi:4-amino-4-deoxy-L-arabinose transferase-like glycosyltransferase